MKNIFVGNLSFGTTDASLRAAFEQFGPVDRASVVMDRETGRSRGFGFVEMSDDAAADQAIAALNGQRLDGRPINVNEARPKEERGGGGGRGGYGGGRRNSGY
jgi:RNA recognition motif-containing protein